MSSAEHSESLVAQATSTAQACLEARDLAGWRRVFAEVAVEPDRHRRYAARKGVLAAGLEGAGEHEPAIVAQRMLMVAQAAVDLLEEEPREPVFLNLAGVALYELGQWTAAEILFGAALRLSPTVPHAADNRVAAGRRRAARVPGPRLPARVASALDDLAYRAGACARRAQPVSGLTASLCMIVRDEEEMLPRCLAAARPAVDEIVVVDTGSTDRTIEIARSFGARVIEREWTGSFAQARNVALDAATGDWILVLDADEILVEGDAPRLRVLLGRTWREAFYLVETNHTGEIGDGTAVTHNTLRLLRNRPEYRYEGRIHEQIGQSLPGGLPERLEASDVRIDHFGYLGVVRHDKDKARRNVELLQRQQNEGDESIFLHFNLGSEYGAAGEVEAAVATFERAWDLVRADPQREAFGFVPALVARLVRARRLVGRAEDAIALADEGLSFLPGFTDLVLEQALAAGGSGDFQRSVELFERCLEMGDAPSRYMATVGAGSFLALVGLADVRKAMGDTRSTLEILRRCLTEHPLYPGAVAPYADALLASGAAAPDVEAAIVELIGTPGPSARFLLAIALYEAGHAAAAEPHLRAVVAAQPRNAGARVALAECLLSLRRWTEAADEAAAVPAGDPRASSARRTELFARIVAADLTGAQRTGVVADGDLPVGELAAYEAWGRAAAGASADVVSREGALSLAVALEALLRVREVDAAGPLAALIERSALQARERHELLAGIYLRRGFLDSAADEWTAACREDGIDAAALTGLARVARAKGIFDDALTLAREAGSLDPACRAASSLIGELERSAECGLEHVVG
ncbi:MAG: glycosyltransferase [Solirubrobacteraceae bacterium]|nr:glycosyltransferase [Solirubrobacteraceae bacterium]